MTDFSLRWGDVTISMKDHHGNYLQVSGEFPNRCVIDSRSDRESYLAAVRDLKVLAPARLDLLIGQSKLVVAY